MDDSTQPVTPDLANLRRYRVDSADPDRIAALAVRLGGDGPLSLAGISIGGSYALVAAARPELAGRLECVFAFGAYADLEQVLRGWMLEPRAARELYDPLVEGRRLVMRGNVDRLVPRADEFPYAASWISCSPADRCRRTPVAV